MKTLIIVYLAVGFLLNLIGPLAKMVNKKIKEIKEPSFADVLLERKPISKIKIVWAEFVLRIFIFLFYPVLYLIIFIDFVRPKPIEIETKDKVRDNLLYYWKMGGAGVINCNVCGFNQEIVSFLHGIESWNNTGFQCQNCGKFHQIESDMSNSKGQKCECGGTLEREKPIFCPKCKTTNVSYDLKYIT